MTCLLHHLEDAARCTEDLQRRVERLARLMAVRRWQGQENVGAEALMGVLDASLRQTAIRRDLVLLQMRMKLSALPVADLLHP